MKRFVVLSVTLALFLSCAHVAMAQDLKIGYVNMRKVFYEYEKTKAFNERLEGEDEKVRDEVEKRTDEIRRLRDEIELLSEEMQEKRRPELRKAIQQLDEFRKGKLEGFIKEKDEMFKEIREDVLEIAQDYAQRNGYDAIFDEAIFVYAGERFDVTEKILLELNKN